ERGEGRQGAAEAGAEQGPPEGRRRQPLLEPRDEVAEQRSSGDVGGEGGRGPAVPAERHRRVEPPARERAERRADEDREQQHRVAVRSTSSARARRATWRSR